jgi:predicted DNA-binding transcriptional regulator AlpA
MTNPNFSNRTNQVERLLPRRELRDVVPVSDMTIWRWERDGRFPRHLSINGRNYWRLSELRDWMDSQERAGASTDTIGSGDVR